MTDNRMLLTGRPSAKPRARRLLILVAAVIVAISTAAPRITRAQDPYAQDPYTPQPIEQRISVETGPGRGTRVEGQQQYYDGQGQLIRNAPGTIYESEALRNKRLAEEAAARARYVPPSDARADRFAQAVSPSNTATQALPSLSQPSATSPSPTAQPVAAPTPMPAIAPAQPPSRGFWSGWFSDDDEYPVGSPEWWDDHEDEAEFEPGKGYRVPGYDGYFDKDGRSIEGPAAIERIKQAGEEDASDGLVPGLDPRVQYDKMKTAVGLGPNEEAARAAYAEGDRLFRDAKYKAAADKFEEAVDRGKFAQIHQDAMFMLAESYFFGDRYIKARDAYDALVQEYASTRYMDALIDREWKIARYWEEYESYNPDWVLTPNGYDKSRPWFDTIGHAIKTYDNIRLNDPTGPRADDAIMATANIYFRRNRYDDADYHYTLLRREYPRSEHQYEAHLLGLQAKLRKYQGEDYDGTPLEEAKTLVKQLRVQFAGELPPEERERLQTVEAQLNHQIAMRDFTMAEQYDGTKYYGSAKMYYAKVIKQYPDSDLARQARERVAQLTGEPDVPPKRMAWFVDLFPESRERSRVARIPELKDGKLRLAQTPSGTSGGNTQTAASPSTAAPR